MTDLGSIILNDLQRLLSGSILFFLRFIPALIVFIIGWFIAAGVGKIVTEILRKLKLDKIFESTGWKEAMEKAEIKITISEFTGNLCKWILILVFLAISSQIIGVERFSAFLFDGIIPWLPNLLVAVLILMVTVIIAHFAEKMVRASAGKAKIGYANFAGAIVKWSIWIFGIFAILSQLGIAEKLVLSLFQGIMALIAIAGGLAFGLGGKDFASDILKSLKEKMKK